MSTSDSFDLSRTSNLIPNLFHGDKYSVVFSNLPSVKDFKDFRYFTNFISSVTLPEYTMDLIVSNFQGAMTRHQIAPNINRGLSNILINFRLTEDMMNYLLLLDYMRSIRFGDLESGNSELISKYTIRSIDINLLDNHKRLIAIISFLNCYPTMISSLNLTFGESSEIIFSTNWSYSQMTYKTQTING